MMDVVIAEAGELTARDMAAAEALVRAAFGDSFRAHDWLHGVDGVHVLITENADLLAHASVVTRTLRYGSASLTTGYVESVAVDIDQQGRGLGRLVMDHAEAIIRARHQLGALNAVESAAPFYAARGWQPWAGHTQADTPDGLVDTYHPDDRIFVLPTAGTRQQLCGSSPLICDWRVGDLW
ncbi:GNAT family N-acetyltransferase [Mycolicibacterium helvum]|uniref:Aminoglycoside N-acetyltransferase AAC(2')-Ie n=1 Tax=Mycolicibacterium helvum TaxID=1534349 RepID=A0A7I7T6D8_9MYCO|nr:GNAT family N-acetyltransferase [Mycolicibacterium helvum]BBY64061.1 aminoglycoside N-acetyltransferase AAC(2')-Ie [Mycolicibacterium helvum]